MTYSLYLDDERSPKTVAPFGEWIVVRSANDAQKHIDSNGYPSYISLDHDLGDNVPTGYDFVKWMVDDHVELVNAGDDIAFPQYNLHTANPVGRDNMEAYLDNYLRFISS